MFGIYIFFWLVVPLCWYFDIFGAQLVGHESIYGFSLNTAVTFNKNGTKLRTKDFVTYNYSSTNFELDKMFYDANKPIRITTTFAVTYITSFIAFVSAMVHVGLWYCRDIWNRFRSVLQDLDADDIHATLMDIYPDVPEWWYITLLVITLGGGITVCQVGGFDLPWWGVILAVALALVAMLPIGIIQAISGQQIGLNVISEFLIGLILPGRIAAVMSFKTFSYMTMFQGLYLVQDLKLGHYVKIPPRAMFIAQIVSTVVGALVSVATACIVYEWFGKIPKPNDPRFPQGYQWALEDQPSDSGWNLSGYNLFLSAGVIWGAIGPAEFFGAGSPYFSTLLGFVAGFTLPVIPWILHKLQPDSFWHLINVPVIVFMPNGLGSQQSALITPLIIAIVVNYYVKKYRYIWWKKYAYVMSAAFDCGSGIAVLAIFFIAKFNQNYLMPFPAWFMNSGDIERCLPDEILTCMDHTTMGSGFGKEYNSSLDTPFCNSFNS
ncbi:UNVERIFIED_CONTAM: hypothetical protein HDU68_000427 [Siphonaria sp. JEL0065]|nr:hypothetical protein HDU68_000427 [Siphonaria sp. JEL0065]